MFTNSLHQHPWELAALLRLRCVLPYSDTDTAHTRQHCLPLRSKLSKPAFAAPERRNFVPARRALCAHHGGLHDSRPAIIFPCAAELREPALFAPCSHPMPCSAAMPTTR